ncbi:MAG TPA: endonuclease/exonuclease/phosphatase family protein [Dokdonella sp.]|uniref:endonuclease/exonuclease/phosphatase family protein n=1 Tax=Dokdonella sp. TaxID=2291710 RepID=UPI002D7E4A63|nr:endonuclease/exonuclease/phosphatase family protein [Dokdonella sp.]HET9031446.1 endonuclease/exonuclease/phosphatase family protein [Dokdonella sp.]
MFIACLIATLLLAAMTALPISRSEVWWERALDFPRLQLAAAGALLLLIEFITLDLDSIATWFLLAVAGLCVAWQAWWIVPFTPLVSIEVKDAPASADPDNALVVLTSNVLGPNRESKKLIDLVRANSPDILVTLESNAWWQEQLDQLGSDFPHAIKCPLENLYGMHVYSRLPLSDSRIEYLVETGIPSIHACVTLRSGQPVSAHFLHPSPPNPQFNDQSSERDAELVMVAKRVAENDKPTIVCGDLNDVAWSSTTRLFRKLSGLLDPRVGRGMFNTFHADWWFMRWPLDHLFHSNHFTLTKLCRLPSIGSDHFPLLTALQFSPEHASEQDGLNTDADDRARGQAKQAQQDVDASDVPEPAND